MKKKITTLLLISSSFFCLNAQIIKDSISSNAVFCSQEIATRYIVQLTSEPINISNIEKQCKAKYRVNSQGYITLRSSLINKAVQKINTEQEEFLTEFNKLTVRPINGKAPKKKILHRYNRALNGFAIEADLSIVSAVEKMRHFKSITQDRLTKVSDNASNAVIGAPAVWQQTGATGKNIKIGILDTGIDPNHPDLKGKVMRGYNFVNNDTIVFDDNGHGTHCAGIAAANGISLKGVAPDALLMPIKVMDAFGYGSFTNIIAGINYAMDPDNNDTTNDGVNILNVSIAGPGLPNDPLAKAINNAFANNLLCVVAAGNDGNNYYTIGTPGCAANALTVGATDNQSQMAPFSASGPIIGSFQVKPDIVAPGVDIYSTLPNGAYASMSGTSAATAHVAGAAALLMELHPTWSPTDIKAALMQSAIEYGPDIWKRGKGRLDILKATQVTTTISPSIISFGNLNTTTFSASQFITVHNLSGNLKTYNISMGSPPSGISFIYPPTISATDSASFTITISVDTSLFHFPTTIPSVYNDRVLISSANDYYYAPLVLNRAELATFTFDRIPERVLLLDSTTVKYYTTNDTTLKVILDHPSQFDIITCFDQYSTIVVREKVLLNNNSHLKISSTEAINEIEISGVDQLGDTLIIKDGNAESLYNKSSDVGLVVLRYFLDDPNYKIKTIKRKISNLSNRYRYALQPVSIPQWNKTKKFYFFPNEFSDGINTNKIVSNTKNEFLCINRKFPPSYSRSNTYLAYYIFDYRIGGGFMISDSLEGMNKNNIFTEYVLPFPSLEYPLKTISAYHLMEKKGSTPNIYTDSILFITGNEVYRLKGLYVATDHWWDTPISVPFLNDTLSINYGLSPTHYYPLFSEDPLKNHLLISRRKQSFFNSFHDVALGKIEYKASFKNGKIISGIVSNDAEFRSILGIPFNTFDTIPTDNDYNSIQFKYSGESLDLFTVVSTATHYKKSSSTNPMPIKRFEFRENGILRII
ncbi:MAG: S8 family serine peptidase [Bacteroidia bacterium]